MAMNRYSIHVIRQTFDDLAHSANLDPVTLALQISSPAGLFPSASPIEISTVYFRAGYTPNDYPTLGHFSTRFLLERSRAINCPSIALQLAGGKKVQEVLTKPGMLERFLCDEKWGNEVFDRKDVDDLRVSWMGMWGLDDDDGWSAKPDIAEEKPGISVSKEPMGMLKARKLASALVLKPQREGGGNNIYKAAIPSFLDGLPPSERPAWIAMELIAPPEGTGNYLMRAGGSSEGAVKADVVSELGIFGWALFSAAGVKEKEVGWLVRTKGRESDEGGVATGFSVLDSVVLIDD